MSRLKILLIAALVGIGGRPCLAEDAVYAFTDGRGQVHLSNFPVDSRFRLLIAPAEKAKAAAAGVADENPRQVRFDEVIREAASRAGIEPALLHAVIAVESGYDARAVSARGAAGLMQLMPSTAKRYRVTDVFDPAQNVRGGAQYLAELLRMFDDDLALALAAYNAGEGAVIRHGRQIPPYRETSAYVPKVIKAYRKYRWTM